MLLAGAVALVALVHLAGALAHPFGAFTDEAHHVSLALSLLEGSYSVPGPFGGPAATPLPGYPLLIAPVIALLGAHAAAYRLLGLAASLGAAWLGWRLCRRTASPPAAGLAALTAALCPALAAQAGVVGSDAAFAALSAGAFLVLDSGRSRAALALLGVVGALMRPQGLLLPAALAYGLRRRGEPRPAAAALGSALAAVCAFELRGRLAGTAGRSHGEMWAGSLSLSGAAAALTETLGRGAAAAVPSLPGWAAAAAGLLLLGLAALGLRRLAGGPRAPLAEALAAFAAGTLAVHLLWPYPTARYGLPLLAPLWALAAAGADGLGAPLRRAAAALAGLWAAAALASGLSAWPTALPPARPAYSALAAWARASLPAGARLESFACRPLELAAGRAARCPAGRGPREAWAAGLLADGIGWAHEPAVWRADGYFPPELQRFARARARWLRDPAWAAPVFEHPEDGTVYRLKPRDAARLSAAVRAFDAAGAALARRDLPALRARLEEAVRLEPGFAHARAMRALLEPDPRARAARLRAALRLEPGSEEILADLEGALKSAGSASGSAKFRP